MMAGWSRRWVKETRIAPTAESGRRRVIAGITGVCRICPFRACRCCWTSGSVAGDVAIDDASGKPLSSAFPTPRSRWHAELAASLNRSSCSVTQLAGGRGRSWRPVLRSRRATAAVRAVGIDDWSWRKGWTYGTIIVDLEQHEVVEVIAERSTQTVADWFARHPEVEIVCRDRCGLYSQGAREGAPQARQVVDRFHVLQNLREAIEHQMSHVSRFAGRSLLSETDSRGASGRADDLQPSRRIQREARVALFDRVQALHAAGKTLRDITAITGVGRPTVRQWVRSGRLADRAATMPTTRSPRYFKDYLSQRWEAGCING